jgi:hypothetical protein
LSKSRAGAIVEFAMMAIHEHMAFAIAIVSQPRQPPGERQQTSGFRRALDGPTPTLALDSCAGTRKAKHNHHKRGSHRRAS